MGYSFENYLAALLWDLQILISPKDWLRRHAPLFGRYVDVCRLCSRLEEGNASVCAHASKLAGEELDSPAEADALYSLKSVFGRLRVEKVSPVVPRYYSPAPLSLTNAFPVEDKKKPDGSVLTALDRELERFSKMSGAALARHRYQKYRRMGTREKRRGSRWDTCLRSIPPANASGGERSTNIRR